MRKKENNLGQCTTGKKKMSILQQYKNRYEYKLIRH